MIRTIVKPKDKNISIVIPTEYIGKEVEILAFTIEESSKKKKANKDTFKNICIDTSNFKFNREEANER